MASLFSLGREIFYIKSRIPSFSFSTLEEHQREAARVELKAARAELENLMEAM